MLSITFCFGLPEQHKASTSETCVYCERVTGLISHLMIGFFSQVVPRGSKCKCLLFRVVKYDGWTRLLAD